MQNFLKYHLKPFLPIFILNKINSVPDPIKFQRWEQAGSPVPPPHFVKQMAILDFQKKYGYTTLVESGTFVGDMVEALKTKFKKIISIELASYLAKKAGKRFKKDRNVVIMEGDSGTLLHQIVPDLKEPVIFWLDGHYSSFVTAKGEKASPIFEELDAIIKPVMEYNHIILIDDARLFNGQGDYPTIDELTTFVKSKNEAYTVDTRHDVIHYLPNL